MADRLLADRSATIALAEVAASPSDKCHTLTHWIGQVLYRRTGDAPRAFQECTGTCFGGCYHGVVEGYLKNQSGPDPAGLAGVCDEISDHGSGLFQDCLHGLGHGMMALTGDELPQSLAICDQFTKPDDCYLGVFMENSTSPTNPDHPSKFLNPKDPLYPCNDLPEKYLKTCYTAQSNYFYVLSRGDWSKTIDLCLSVPTAYQEGCVSYIGGNVIFFGQADKLDDICNKLADKSLVQACFRGGQETQAGLSR